MLSAILIAKQFIDMKQPPLFNEAQGVSAVKALDHLKWIRWFRQISLQSILIETRTKAFGLRQSLNGF